MRRFAVVLRSPSLVAGASAQRFRPPGQRALGVSSCRPCQPVRGPAAVRSVLPAGDDALHRHEIKRMRLSGVGCDHRAVFETTYLELTRIWPRAARAPATSSAGRTTSTWRTRCSRTSTSTPSATRAAAGRCPRLGDRVRRRGLAGCQRRPGHAARHQRARAERHALRARRARASDTGGESRRPTTTPSTRCSTALRSVVSAERDFDPLFATNSEWTPLDDVPASRW